MPRAVTRRRIIDATLDCIAQHGVQRLSLVEVAAVAGLGRQTVYRHFASRDDLITAALIARLDAVVARLRPVSESCADLREALTVLNVASVRAVKEDPLLSTIIESSGDRRLERFMMARDSPLVDQTMVLWGQHLRRARAAGELQDGLEDLDIAAWIRAVQLVLLLRDDLDAGEQATMLRQFLVPAICR